MVVPERQTSRKTNQTLSAAEWTAKSIELMITGFHFRNPEFQRSLHKTRGCYFTGLAEMALQYLHTEISVSK